MRKWLSWRTAGKVLLLALFAAGQGRLAFHYHVDVADRPATSAVTARHKTLHEEGPCRLCELIAQSQAARLTGVSIAPSAHRVEAVAALQPEQDSAATLIRVSARAPPAC